MIPHQPSCPSPYRGHSCPHCGLTLVYPMRGTTLFCPTSERTYEIGEVVGAGQACEPDEAVAERAVHWRWLHGPTPPDQQESPHQIAERRYHGYTYGRTA